MSSNSLWTTCRAALVAGKYDIVEMHVRNGFNLNYQSTALWGQGYGGSTLLISCSAHGMQDAVWWLLSQPGIDIYIKNSRQKMAKDYAIENGYPDIAKLFDDFSAKKLAPRPLSRKDSSSSVSSNTSRGSTREMVVDTDGKKKLVILPDDSLESLVQALQEKFSLSSGFSIDYFNPDFNEYVGLDSISMLPAKPKLKLSGHAHPFWVIPNKDSSDWVEKGIAENRYHSLLVKDGEVVNNQVIMEKFALLASQLGFEPSMAQKIYSISNSNLESAFDIYRKTLYGKHRQSAEGEANLFFKDGWKKLPESDQRNQYLQLHNALASRFPLWNDLHAKVPKPFVIPYIQGTNEQAAWQICQQGFGVTSTTDDGYFGRGIYFTDKYSYANRYATPSNKVTGYKVYLLAMVIPGNPFPVTEHPFIYENGRSTVNPEGYLGKACRPGYQSHITIVNTADIKTPFPVLTPQIDPLNSAEEVVIFESNAALPLFVFYAL
jgi:hypothetical protein